MVSQAVWEQAEENRQPIDFVEAIQNEAEEFLSENGGLISNLFKVQSANKWLDESKTRPAPKTLFDEFWFEGEICILFADTNVGKSILAVQIADNISKNKKEAFLPPEIKAQPIIYFDFELSDKQFEARYSVKSGDYFANHYEFSDNFLRAEINPDNYLPERFETFEDYLNFSIQQSIAETGAKILIIDNLTYLRNGTEKAQDALPLMKHLKTLKSKFDLYSSFSTHAET